MDLGEAYTGVAISDPGGSLSRPLEVVPSTGLTEYLCTLLPKEGIEEVVVGVPKTLKGELGFQAKLVLAKLDALRDAFPALRFVEWDERLTTRLALSSASKSRSGGRSTRGKREATERLDHLAAAGMLQEYLNWREMVEATRQSP